MTYCFYCDNLTDQQECCCQLMTPHQSPNIPQPATDQTLENSPEDREYTGSPLFPNMRSFRTYLRNARGSRDNWNLERIVTSFTGNLLLLSNGKYQFTDLENVLDHTMVNLPVPTELKTTVGRRILECQELDSVWVRKQLIEHLQMTGMPSGLQLYQDKFWISLPILGLEVITHSAELGKTICDQLYACEELSSIGDLLELERADGPGMKPVWRHIARTPALNSGQVIKVSQMLSLTNLEAVSTSLTFYDGLIGILFTLRPKEEVCPYEQIEFGLPQIYIHELGTPM